jgi:beta-fructofuranosidase
VSDDLVGWTILPDALAPGAPGSWDDLATWTGSVVEAGGTWFLFYTGISRGSAERVQQVGLATSPDLVRWERWGDRPLIRPDPAWYQTNAGSGPIDQAWRDPFVFADPAGNGFHALIAATRTGGPLDARGAIAHASSSDLIEWTVHPPLTAPAGFGQHEVPQVTRIGDEVILAFCTDDGHVSARRRAERPGTGTYLCRGRDELGPFAVGESTTFAPFSPLYAGKVVPNLRGAPAFIGFANVVDGRFVGELSDPAPLDLAVVQLCGDPEPES